MPPPFNSSSLVRLAKQTSPRSIVIACLSIASAGNSFATEKSSPVYRCPGPPIVYKDDISAIEAKKGNCKTIEAMPYALPPLPTPSRWIEVGANEKFLALVDIQSMRRTGRKVKVWVKWIYTSPSDTEFAHSKKPYQSEKSLSYYDCEAQTMLTIQVIRYSEKYAGEVVESYSNVDKLESYREVAPETIGERVLNFVCAAKIAARP